MHRLVILSLTVTLLSLSHCSADTMYPTFVQCNPITIADIKAYWLLTGTPTDVLNKVDGVQYTLLDTSYNNNIPNTKCIYVDVSGGQLNVSHTNSDGSDPTILTYKVSQQDDGTLRGVPEVTDEPEFAWTLYTLVLKDNVWVYYACSTSDKGSEKIALAAVLISSPASAASVASYAAALTRMGFNLDHNYGTECIRSGSSQSSPMKGLRDLPPKVIG